MYMLFPAINMTVTCESSLIRRFCPAGSNRSLMIYMSMNYQNSQSLHPQGPFTFQVKISGKEFSSLYLPHCRFPSTRLEEDTLYLVSVCNNQKIGFFKSNLTLAIKEFDIRIQRVLCNIHLEWCWKHLSQPKVLCLGIFDHPAINTQLHFRHLQDK